MTRAGSRSFVLDYRAGGRQRRMTIGAYPDWNVAAARDEARVLKRDVDAGVFERAARARDMAEPGEARIGEQCDAAHAEHAGVVADLGQHAGAEDDRRGVDHERRVAALGRRVVVAATHGTSLQ